MKAMQTELPGVIEFEPDFFGDSRGGFMETYHSGRYREFGLESDFVQDNLSYSARGVLRGLHVQNPNSQGKLVQVLQGEVFDVAVDIRRGSPHFGGWVGRTLSDSNRRQLYIPEGFAHGFCVLSEKAIFAYKCTRFYDPASEMSLIWNDPDIAIDWPLTDPELSAKDRQGIRLRDVERTRLPVFSVAEAVVA